MVGLARLATYHIPSSTANLVIARGSVVDFSYPPYPKLAAIVNAANEGCLGGGGVDGAISDAGGPDLQLDREALPVVGAGIRCPTGDAKLTGPGNYGTLQVNYVIHAVGPCYWDYPSFEEPDKLLDSAYRASLDRASEAKLKGVAFSLLSAGVYRGEREVSDVLQVGVQAICDHLAGKNEYLQDVFMCAFSGKEAETLTSIAMEMGLKEVHPEL